MGKWFICTVYVTTVKQRTIAFSAYALHDIYSKTYNFHVVCIRLLFENALILFMDLHL